MFAISLRPRSRYRIRAVSNRRILKLCLFLTALAIAANTFLPSRLNAVQNIVDQFPDPQRVIADYKDDAERYAALKALYDSLGDATKGGGIPGAYQKSSNYFQAFSLIADKYSMRAN